MQYTITFSTDNAAFEESPDGEVRSILERLQSRTRTWGLEEEVPLFDSNGNQVGTATWTEEV